MTAASHHAAHIGASRPTDHAARAMVRLLPGLRAEEFIARGRLILALGLVLAVTGDDGLSTNGARTAQILLAAYSVVAAGVLVGLHFARTHLVRYRALLHALDIAALAWLLILTGGAASGYFSPLFFPIASGALRWRQRGVVQTGIVVLIVFSTVALADYVAGDLLINAWIARTVALVATVLLIGEMGAVEGRYVGRILNLSRWPRLDAANLDTLAAQLVARAASVFEARRAILVLEDFDEPWEHVFRWSSGTFAHERRSAIERGTGSPLERYPFFVGAGGASSALFLDDGGPQVQRAAQVAPWLRAEFGDRPIVGIPLSSESVRGHLFLLDAPNIGADDLRLAELLGRQVTDSLEQFALGLELRYASAAQERARVSRDLHDGVLQTLSGIALRITSLRKDAAATEGTRDQLLELERLMLDEQRSLRFFTEELRERAAGPDVLIPVDALVGMIHRLERIWSVQVTWDPLDAERVPARLAADVYRVVHEAIVNAARHGQARNVHLRISSEPGVLRVVVKDDGCGFPFKGRFTLGELASARRGPRTLRERVQDLGGQLYVTSSAAGSEIEVVLGVGEMQS